MNYTRYDLELKDRLPHLVAEPAYCDTDCDIIGNPETVNTFVCDALRLDRKAEEHMILLALDCRCRLLGVMPLAKGIVYRVYCSPREIFMRLLMCGAVYFIAVHNHPSGQAMPSEADDKLTERMKSAGKLMCVKMLDHIIIGADGSFYSYTKAERQRKQESE